MSSLLIHDISDGWSFSSSQTMVVSNCNAIYPRKQSFIWLTLLTFMFSHLRQQFFQICLLEHYKSHSFCYMVVIMWQWTWDTPCFFFFRLHCVACLPLSIDCKTLEMLVLKCRVKIHTIWQTQPLLRWYCRKWHILCMWPKPNSALIVGDHVNVSEGIAKHNLV